MWNTTVDADDPEAARLLLESQQYEKYSVDSLDRIGEARDIQGRGHWLHHNYNREIQESDEGDIREACVIREIERRKRDEEEAVTNIQREEAELKQHQADKDKEEEVAKGGKEERHHQR